MSPHHLARTRAFFCRMRGLSQISRFVGTCFFRYISMVNTPYPYHTRGSIGCQQLCQLATSRQKQVLYLTVTASFDTLTNSKVQYYCVKPHVSKNLDNMICSATGNRTPVSRVTGGDTSHYTMTEGILPGDNQVYELRSNFDFTVRDKSYQEGRSMLGHFVKSSTI